MKKLFITLTLLICTVTLLLGQSNILVIDYNNAFSSDRSMNNSRVYNHLVATQGTVTRVGSVPATISNALYDQCWIYGNPGPTTPTILNPVVNFINGGGAVYVQSEVSCCNNQAAYAQAIMRAVVSGGSGIVHNPTRGSYYRFENGAGFACPGIAHYGAAVRPYTGMTMTNALWRGATGCGSSVSTSDIVAVMFRSCDMISGRGAFASAGDFNMFIQSSTCGSVGIIGTPNYTAMIDLVHDRFVEALNCAPCGVVLPAEVADFTAERKDGAVQVDWTTMEERHLDFFTVEKSKDQETFVEVEQVRGALNSNTEVHYQVVDQQPYSGYSYYRLKSTDTDGEIHYSEVQMVSFEGLDGVEIFYAGQKDRLIIDNFQENSLSVELLDVTGKKLGEVTVAAGERVSYETEALAPGVYIARASSQRGGMLSRKFVVGR